MHRELSSSAEHQRPERYRPYGQGALSKSHDAYLSRELVHKAVASEVLLSKASRVGEDRFHLTARLASGNSLFASATSGTGDLLFFAEAVRQAGSSVSHLFYDVPLDRVFILDSMNLEMCTEGLPCPARSDGAVEVELRCSFRDAGTNRRRFAKTYRTDLIQAGRRWGSATVGFTTMSRATFDRLRQRSSPAPAAVAGTSRSRLPPSRVGRHASRDVLLGNPQGGAGNEWELLLDREHPFYFDHPIDHIPGMALLEAMRQAVQAHGGVFECLVPRSMDVEFGSFAELDQAVSLEVSPLQDAPRRLRVTARQGERFVASAAVQVTEEGVESVLTPCEAA